MQKIYNKNLTIFVVISFFCFAHMQIAWADLDEANKAYYREDYTTAFREFSVLAEQGNARSQTALGVMFSNGQGVSKDEQQAVIWYLRAAEQGDAAGQFNLASKYYYGLGVFKDEQQALSWYRKSASKGYSAAEFSLGVIYAEGLVVNKDNQQALFWYRKAADKGNVNAQVNLANMYSFGEGITKDDKQSLVWYRKAAEQGNAQAQYNLGNGYYEGLGLPKNVQQAYFWWLLAGSTGDENAKHNIKIAEKNLSSQQREQAQADARNWRPKTAQQIAKIGLADEDENNSDATSSAPQTKGTKSSGSGFVVSPNKIVTNVHVVNGCVVLKVNGKLATLHAMDKTNDLALLNTSLISGVATLGSVNLRQGDVINAVGYPLHGLLASGAQITSGNVSALAGMQNDSRFIQISAPVQPGNSGGPLVDASGNVVGVIVSKLNAVAIASVNGDIPQNINFAISPLVLKGFLEANQVKYKTAGSNKNLSTTNVMSIAIRYTVLIECTK